MKNTKMLLEVIGLTLAFMTAGFGIAKLTIVASGYRWWGFALYIALIIAVPLALAIRADLKGRKA